MHNLWMALTRAQKAWNSFHGLLPIPQDPGAYIFRKSDTETDGFQEEPLSPKPHMVQFISNMENDG